MESSPKDIRKVLGTDPATAKATLARYTPQIVLKPAAKPDGRKVYQVTSEWELLEGALALWDGAEGRNSTERLTCGFRFPIPTPNRTAPPSLHAFN